MKEKIYVANVKCHGCASTIVNKLGELSGMRSVNVNPNEDLVEVDYDEVLERAVIINRLHALGYPEATEENGLLLQLKSYASCMVGRMTK